MIVNVYAYKNKLLDCFANPIYDDHNEEQVIVSVSRDLRAKVIQKDVENLRYLDLYKLGEFDDVKGVFVNSQHLLLDLGSTIAGLEAQFKEKAQPVKEA